MTEEVQKEHFSYAYARAVCAVERVSVTKPEVDDDSVDLMLNQTGTGTAVRSPRLDLQVKCSALGAVTIIGSDIHYPLKKKNYDDLRVENLHVPRALLVVVVPDNASEWLGWTPTEMAMRRAGYWCSLRGLPTTTNSTSVTVRIPLSQEFSPTQLREIIRRIGEGQPL